MNFNTAWGITPCPIIEIMYYYFTPSTYLVKGALHSCIYDLPHNQLHKINATVYKLLLRVTKGESIEDTEENNFLNELVSIGVLQKEHHEYKSIEDSYSYSRNIDFAWIELTNICNLKCIHCYNEQESVPKRTLTLQELKYVVDELRSIGVKNVQLIGGEPFVIRRDVLFEMIDYVASHMETFEVFINGTLNTEDDLIILKEKYPNLHIATSLHSYIEEEHEKVTNIKGSYQKTLGTLQSLCKLDIPHRFVGALIGGVCVGSDCGVGEPSRRDYIRLSGKANLKLYNDELLKKRMISEEKIHSGNIEETLKYNYNQSCFATHLYIGSDMNVYPCPMERRIFHGNLRNGHLHDMLNSHIMNMSKNDIDVCKDCEYRYLCLDCRPDSLNGELYEKPWYCSYNPYSGKWESFDEFKNRLYC